MYTVDLNSDLGESFGNYKIGNDDKVIPLISSANVACGYHASDPVVMGNTLAMAKDSGKPFSMDAAMAKLRCAETAMDVTTKCVQLHGGYGYSRANLTGLKSEAKRS